MNTQTLSRLCAAIEPLGIRSLPAIAAGSFAEFRHKVRTVLSWYETKVLYQAAEAALSVSRNYEARLLARANPLLTNAVRLALTPPSAELHDYRDLFGTRASQFVAPGSVASMFSPAAYLTEMYREARALRDQTSIWHLDNRRPDLRTLVLSQHNQDDIVSMLDISNNILMAGIRAYHPELADEAEVLQQLASWRTSGSTPFHAPFEQLCHALQLRDPQGEQRRASPEVTGLMSAASQRGLDAGISPELYAILTEVVTDENAQALCEHNFPIEAVSQFQNVQALARYYDVAAECCDELLRHFVLRGYVDGCLVYPEINGQGDVAVKRIIRSVPNEPAGLAEAALIPRSGDLYFLTCRFDTLSVQASGLEIRVNDVPVFSDEAFQLQTAQEYRIALTLEGIDLTQPVQVAVITTGSGAVLSRFDLQFRWQNEPPYRLLLEFNKLIRLQRVTGLAPDAVVAAVASVHRDWRLDTATLQRMLDIWDLMRQYGIDHDQALCLSNGDICRLSFSEQPSAFDRLFNAALRSGERFDTGGPALDMKPESQDNDPRKTALKQALQVDDLGLYQLLCIAEPGNSNGMMDNELASLSALWRARLLAELNRLSVDELVLLLAGCGESEGGMHGHDDISWRGVRQHLQHTMGWLNALEWDVSLLFVLTTTLYSNELTPEIQTLLTTLNSNLQDQALHGEVLIEALAPYVAAALRLAGSGPASNVLRWIDQLQPSGMGVDAFWAAIAASDIPVPAVAIQFCHALAQLALVYQSTGLDEGALRLLVTQPKRMITLADGVSVAGHDSRVLMQLTAYAAWVQQLGSHVSATLSAFSADTLTPEKVAQALVLDEERLRQAAATACRHQQIAASDQLHSWPEIDVVMQWVTLSEALGVTPQGVADWLALDYLSPTPPTVPYPAWQAVATTQAAGLRTEQAQMMAEEQAEALSDTLAGYWLQVVAPPTLSLRTRDDLYGYLLIDSQVSAQVMTSRVAEATACLQLYINRALDRMEPDVDDKVIGRRFFDEWGSYNKRYSTWAGVSQLAYYPENYIEPTLRLGQTSMMDKLLQELGQSALNSDTVGDAFNRYLADFEQVANLEVISAYHDDFNVEQGLTYFIGCNRAAEVEYYWRSADHDKCHDGQFAASAWNDWRKIDNAFQPWREVVRPVVKQSRLHLLWLERVEYENEQEGSGTPAYRYELKLSWLRYDGNWSTPLSYPADDLLAGLNLGPDEQPGFYCAENPDDDILLVLCYRKQDNTATVTVNGLIVLSDGSMQALSEQQALFYRDSIHIQFDTPLRRRVNNRYARESYSVPTGLQRSGRFDYGSNSYSCALGGDIAAISSQSQAVQLQINLSPTVVVKFQASQNDYIGPNLETIRMVCSPGDQITVMKIKNFGPIFRNGTFYDNVKCFTQNMSGNSYSLWRYEPGTGYYFRIFTTIIPSNRLISGPADLTIGDKTRFDIHSGIIGRVLESSDYHGGDDFEFISDIPLENVTLIIKEGATGPEYRFSADQYMATPPPDSLESRSYPFSQVSCIIDPTQLTFVNNIASLDVTLEAKFADGSLAGREYFSLPITRVESDVTKVLTLLRDNSGAQYMQWGPYRVRMNTLFARQLVERAVHGPDAILSMSSQRLPEPAMGNGGYVQVTLPRWNAAQHGTSRAVKLRLRSVNQAVSDYPFINASLTDSAQQRILFVPVSQISQGDVLDFPATLSQGLELVLECEGGAFSAGRLTFNLDASPDSFSRADGWSDERDADVQVMENYSEPMDFSGANALYFWELFYYTPMMVAQRLLQEQQFDEAHTWLQYVWNPAGYLINGQRQDWQWNVRPLEEDLSWNAGSLDSTDPDAVAQNDPMHYKVATFMRWLDLLLARGDRAYRQLEPDTLSEAKMWYTQALSLLGEQPLLPRVAPWSEPHLALAADDTLHQNHLQALLSLQQGGLAAPLTASSLTALFLPQSNEVLLGYWRTLEMRLYNLRHNLSIDGHPLRLPLFAAPANPKALLRAAVANETGGGTPTPVVAAPAWRFRQMLDSARGMVTQVMQSGSSLQGLHERQDTEDLAELLQTQAGALLAISLQAQDTTLLEIAADQAALAAAEVAATARRDHYTNLYNGNLNSNEEASVGLRASAGVMMTAATPLMVASSVQDSMPNIFGLANGGRHKGAILMSSALVCSTVAAEMLSVADSLSQSESYRRRREDWGMQRDNASNEIEQIGHQKAALTYRQTAAQQQKSYIELQQTQVTAQLQKLRSKFTGMALYSRLVGILAPIYKTYYDLTVSRCRMAEQAFNWETGDSTIFITPVWNEANKGLLSGDSLMLQLAQMEDAFLQQEQRALEVERTVSLAEFYTTAAGGAFNFAEQVRQIINNGSGQAGSGGNLLSLVSGVLSASVVLSDMHITEDYPAAMQMGNTRRIKQVSVSLPALVGPYQNIQARLSYGGSVQLPRGCNALAVSQCFKDSGQFELNFNDGKYQPFEGIDIADNGTLTLAFPNALLGQKAMLETLNDIVLHIRYTIR